MSEYTEMTHDFLESTDTKVYIRKDDIVQGFPFADDKMMHNKYRVYVSNDRGKFNFPFYDSYYNYINNKKPTVYDVLACLNKYPVSDDLWDFINEFGYEIHCKKDYERAVSAYEGCRNEYENLARLYTEEELERLREIS